MNISYMATPSLVPMIVLVSDHNVFTLSNGSRGATTDKNEV